MLLTPHPDAAHEPHAIVAPAHVPGSLSPPHQQRHTPGPAPVARTARPTRRPPNVRVRCADAREGRREAALRHPDPS
eukprot:5376090-Prymnesium_polylepis.1